MPPRSTPSCPRGSTRRRSGTGAGRAPGPASPSSTPWAGRNPRRRSSSFPPTFLEPRGLLAADKKGRRLAHEFIDEILAGGWAPRIQGLWEAQRHAGVDPFGRRVPDEPKADTLLLCSSGVPRGGQLMYGPAIVEDVRRWFRFARIRIHTVRVDDAAEPAEEVMKGIAEVTGGTCIHRTKP